MILPGATLGILGGGQLGRMFTVAARTMGYHVVVLDPDVNSPAGRIADEHVHAAYTDDCALQQLAESCVAVTTEFENVPAPALQTLEQSCAVRPSASALQVTQERIREKTFIRDCGQPTAQFHVIRQAHELPEAVQSLRMPAILKSSTHGYDGKGQVEVGTLQEAQSGFDTLGKVPCVLEEKIDLALEVSVVMARSTRGKCVFYPIAENEHVNGILNLSIVPARVSDSITQTAREMAKALADSLEYCGVMAVEFFVTRQQQLLVNEIAPRPHNSGHFTIDACVTSQFEQQVRMVCELPAGDTNLMSPVVMTNLLGDLWDEQSPAWSRIFEHPQAKLHLYGKKHARPGRKMGHICYLDENIEICLSASRKILKALQTHH